MYFAILGKNPDISKAELQLIQPTNISSPKKGVITFDTDQPELISTLGGIIKAGPVVREKDLPTILENVSIIGIKELANGKHLKNTIGIRRFKLVDFPHTDKEIKEKGKELINIGNGDYGVVEWYQNISLYETIDFEKPGRSMRMGMMPSKLAHMMINIGLNELGKKTPQLSTFNLQPSTIIYDPFVGSGTTGFLANALGYDFIGSDININYAKENAERRGKNKLANNEHSFNLFLHDINEPINSPLIKGAGGICSTLLIITEGRLGPIITTKTTPIETQRNQREVLSLYKAFLQRIKELSTGNTCLPVGKVQLVTVVTIPYYQAGNFIEKELVLLGQKLGLSVNSIPEVYQREKQNIGRKILIIK